MPTIVEKPKVVQATRVFVETMRAWHDGYRYCLHEGGTSSSKTWSILQALLNIAQTAKEPMLISIVSESLPHLKRGCIRDLFTILGQTQDDNPAWSKTEFIYHKGKWDIEFFGADDQGKVRGPRRKVLFINEGNNVPWETARALDVRTEIFTIVDWNPVAEFWAHDHWLKDPRTHYVHSTYLDAKDVLPEDVVKNIEAQKGDPGWWDVYGLGLIGKIEGQVYHGFGQNPYGFEQIDSLPEGRYFYGLDFGFTNDPSVLTKHVIIGDSLYSQELFYETGLTNDQIARKMDLGGVGFDVVYADAAEPKSIEEINRKHINIMPTEKGAGSVEYGIQKVNQFKQFWTKDSLNCIRDQRNLHYLKDEDGEFTKKTDHKFSHGMDSRRYAVAGFRQRTGGGVKQRRLTDRR